MSPAQKNNNWQPSAAISELQNRATTINGIRAFFAERNVLEVETPLMCRTSVTDPFIESIPAHYQAHPEQKPQQCYLQTSPEYAMKRLLAAGSGSIFQICKAFRQGEIGHHHNPEFTLLEWYRTDFNHLQLMDEVDALLQRLLQTSPADKISYQSLFQTKLGINIHEATLKTLQQCAVAHGINVQEEVTDCDTWLTLLLSHCIEPELGMDRPCFIYNFPASQAALARINHGTPPTAARFEVYYRGMELANGFHELQSADEQRERFEKNNLAREALKLKAMPIDQLFLSGLAAGLPDCSGVALGVDRLVMLATNRPVIQDVISFDISRV